MIGLHADISNDAYHAMTDWLSSTQLKALLPEHYKSGGSAEALSFGSLFHEVVLEPELTDRYVSLDADKIGVKADGSPAQVPTMTAAWKNAVAEVEADGHVVVARADMDRAEAMRDAVAAHPEAVSLIYGEGGSNEESAFWVDENGLRHKARFDRRIEGALIDLKSTAAKPGAHSLTRVCIDYGYELSAAHYMAVAAGLGLNAATFLHVWVEKVAPYRVTVTELDEQFIKRGMDLRARAIERALAKSEPYEGATGRLTLFCPEWAIPFEEMSL